MGLLEGMYFGSFAGAPWYMQFCLGLVIGAMAVGLLDCVWTVWRWWSGRR